MIRKLRIAFPMFVLAFAAAPVGAQGAEGSRAQAQRQAGPTIATAAVGVHVEKAVAARPATPPRRVENNRNRAMMIVGGVALVVGAVLPDPARPLLMTAGALVGLYGLYKYLE